MTIFNDKTKKKRVLTIADLSNQKISELDKDFFKFRDSTEIKTKINSIDYRNDIFSFAIDFYGLVESDFKDAATALFSQTLANYSNGFDSFEAFTALEDLLDLYQVSLHQGIINENDIQIPKSLPMLEVAKEIISNNPDKAINKWIIMNNNFQIQPYQIKFLFDFFPINHNNASEVEAGLYEQSSKDTNSHFMNNNLQENFRRSIKRRLNTRISYSNKIEDNRDLVDLIPIAAKAFQGRILTKEDINEFKDIYSPELMREAFDIYTANNDEAEYVVEPIKDLLGL